MRSPAATSAARPSTRFTSTRAAWAARVRRTSCGHGPRWVRTKKEIDDMATTTTEKSEAKPDKADKAADKNATEAIRERDPAREKAIDVAVSTIEKQFG